MDSSGVRLILYVLVLLNIYVTRLVVKDDYLSFGQKVLQASIIWFIPIIGAIFVWIAYRAMQKTLKESTTHIESTLSYGNEKSPGVSNGDSGGE